MAGNNVDEFPYNLGTYVGLVDTGMRFQSENGPDQIALSASPQMEYRLSGAIGPTRFTDCFFDVGEQGLSGTIDGIKHTFCLFKRPNERRIWGRLKIEGHADRLFHTDV